MRQLVQGDGLTIFAGCSISCVVAAELPRVFQDSSASDLRGADLPSFLTLVDKATDPQFQERLQGSKAKLAQLQQLTAKLRGA